MRFNNNNNLLAFAGAMGSLSSTVLAAPAPDVVVDPRQISFEGSFIDDFAFPGGSASIRVRIYRDDNGAAAPNPITAVPIPTLTTLLPPKPTLCTALEQDACLPGNVPSRSLCGYLQQQLLLSAASPVPGSGNSVCIAEVVQGAAASYCCAHTSQRVAGLTYGDLLLPTTRLNNQCVVPPNSQQGKIKNLSLVQRNACVNFCLDNKPTGCT
ncbi:uncharacterized protein PG986_004710 [Apiospora aurea]|uniref:Uncharacterized protein n=1 Tax=Apiospora aurea TaxID=335848 RepID=A0ABR1QND8_9PEZI